MEVERIELSSLANERSNAYMLSISWLKAELRWKMPHKQISLPFLVLEPLPQRARGGFIPGLMTVGLALLVGL